MKKTLLALGLAAILLTGCDGPTKIVKDISTPGTTVNTKVLNVKASLKNTFTLDGDGNLYVQGTNVQGEFGDGSALGTVYKSPVKVASNVKDFAVADDFVMIVKNDGTVWASGDNDNGQLGLGNIDDVTTLTEVTGLTGVSSIAVGDNYTMAVTSTGKLYATGANATGQFGNGTKVSSTSFIDTGITSVSKVVASKRPWVESTEGNTAIIKVDGSLWVAGANGSGQLGDGTLAEQDTFKEITGIVADIKDVSMAAFSCAVVTENGELYTTGDNWFGQLGTGDLYNSTKPSSFTKIIDTGVESVDIGQAHTLLVKTDGTVWGAGENFWGNLGLTNYGLDSSNDSYKYSTFTQITGLSSITKVFSTHRNSYVVTSRGNLYVAGDNEYGQIGDGTTAQRTAFTLVTSN